MNYRLLLVAGVFCLAVGGVSYLVAGRRTYPLFGRLVAALTLPGVLVFLALLMPTYRPGRNIDDWRRGTLLNLALLSAAPSVLVQAVLVIRQYWSWRPGSSKRASHMPD